MSIEAEIEFALKQMNLLPTNLGLAVAGNGSLVRQIENGRRPGSSMIRRIRAYIATERDARGLPHVSPMEALNRLLAVAEAELAALKLLASRSQ